MAAHSSDWLETTKQPFRLSLMIFVGLLNAVVGHLFNDLSKLFLKRLYSLLCVATEVFVP